MMAQADQQNLGPGGVDQAADHGDDKDPVRALPQTGPEIIADDGLEGLAHPHQHQKGEGEDSHNDAVGRDGGVIMSGVDGLQHEDHCAGPERQADEGQALRCAQRQKAGPAGAETGPVQAGEAQG